MGKNKKPTVLFGEQYFVSMIFWIIFTVVIIAFLVLFINESERINNENNVSQFLAEIAAGQKSSVEVQEIYNNLISITYPLINFSLL